MAFIEILLFGALLVAIYVFADAACGLLERRLGKPLGGWRSLVFFVVFLALLLLAMNLMPMFSITPTTG